MAYFKKTVLHNKYENFVEALTTELYLHGFTILNISDIRRTLKEYLKNGPVKYEVISVIHPYLYSEIMNNGFPGYILPCEITIREQQKNSIEIMAFNALKLMADDSLNPSFQNITEEITRRLDSTIERVALKKNSNLNTESQHILNVD